MSTTRAPGVLERFYKRSYKRGVMYQKGQRQCQLHSGSMRNTRDSIPCSSRHGMIFTITPTRHGMR